MKTKVFLLVLYLAGTAFAEKADLVLRNGVIITMDESMPQASALAIGGEDRGGVPSPIPLDGGDVPVPIGDGAEAPLGVVAELGADGPGEGLARAAVPALGAEDVDLGPLLAGDEELPAREAGEGRPDPAEAAVVEVGHEDEALGIYGHAQAHVSWPGEVELGLGRS